MTESKTGGHRPNSEVPERAKRRRFSAQYKLKVLQEVDRCSSGNVGALLRREALYSSHLVAWRRQRNEGALASLSKKRGRKSKQSPEQNELEKLRKENARLRERERQLELIVAAQKKVAALEQALKEVNE